MNEITRFEDLSFLEKIDIFVQQISGHEKESEINYMLALFTSYALDYKTAQEYNLSEYTTDGLIHLFDRWLDEDDIETTEMFWAIALKSLGSSMIFDIIDNIEVLMIKYNKLRQPLEEIWSKILALFTKTNFKDIREGYYE